MNKSEQIEARRELLRYWIAYLTDAYEANTQEIQSLLDTANGVIVQVPMMKIVHPSRDMMDVLLSGLQCAIEGNSDPFQLNPPKGIKPRLNRQKRIELVVLISQEIAAGKTLDDAFNIAGERFNVSFSTARDSYYELKGWAEIYLHVEKTRYNK